MIPPEVFFLSNKLSTVLYHLPKTNGSLTKRMLLLTRSVSGVTLKLLVGDVVNVVDEVLITLEIAGSTPAPTILKLLYLKTSKSFFFIVANKFPFLSSEKIIKFTFVLSCSSKNEIIKLDFLPKTDGQDGKKYELEYLLLFMKQIMA